MKIFVTLKALREEPELLALANLLEVEITRARHTPFIASRELQKRGLHPGFMHYIRAELESSDLLLLMYHPDLRGGLIEQGIAYALNIPVWLAHPVGLKISTTARECATRLISYQDETDLITQIQQNLTLPKETS